MDGETVNLKVWGDRKPFTVVQTPHKLVIRHRVGRTTPCVLLFIGGMFFTLLGIGLLAGNPTPQVKTLSPTAPVTFSPTAAPTATSAPTTGAPTLTGAPTAAPTSRSPSAAPTTPTAAPTVARVTTSPTAETETKPVPFIIVGGVLLMMSCLFGGLMGGCKFETVEISKASTPRVLTFKTLAWMVWPLRQSVQRMQDDKTKENFADIRCDLESTATPGQKSNPHAVGQKTGYGVVVHREKTGLDYGCKAWSGSPLPKIWATSLMANINDFLGVVSEDAEVIAHQKHLLDGAAVAQRQNPRKGANERTSMLGGAELGRMSTAELVKGKESREKVRSALMDDTSAAARAEVESLTNEINRYRNALGWPHESELTSPRGSFTASPSPKPAPPRERASLSPKARPAPKRSPFKSALAQKKSSLEVFESSPRAAPAGGPAPTKSRSVLARVKGDSTAAAAPAQSLSDMKASIAMAASKKKDKKAGGGGGGSFSGSYSPTPAPVQPPSDEVALEPGQAMMFDEDDNNTHDSEDSDGGIG